MNLKEASRIENFEMSELTLSNRSLRERIPEKLLRHSSGAA